jgi:ABC-type multidrug transport system ATPase subunit
MTTAIVDLLGAKRFYGKRLAMSIDSLQIFENDCLAITGRNGAGKSTLLRVLAGITRLTKGRFEAAPSWRAGAVAYCPQDGGLYGDLTLSENVQCMVRRFSSRSSHGLFEELLHNSELVENSAIPVRKLSGGFQKLAMIATALATNAQILILDEPTADLHFTHQKIISEIISRASSHYLAVVFADHSDVMLRAAKRTVQIGLP